MSKISWDPVLPPMFSLESTKRFQIIELTYRNNEVEPKKTQILLDWNCPYSRLIIKSACHRRPWCKVTLGAIEDSKASPTSTAATAARCIEIADFENIVWENVVTSNHYASSYLVRKGLSRKAQLSLQIKRYLAKYPSSPLKKSVPETVIVETWNAFEDLKIDFGGLSASFDLPLMSRASLRERLYWTLSELYATHFVDQPEPPLYILKPSVTNKGADISLIPDWDSLLDRLEECLDQREWVLQKYIQNPLLIAKGHKFHLRVYVLCVGALRVFVFQDVLVLIAAHRYNNDVDDIYAHLTNTARAAEKEYFDEKKFVKLISDLPTLLLSDYPTRFPDLARAREFVENIRQQVNNITAELFRCYENEYSVFSPMPHCFEIFGLDFLVSRDGNVFLLEVNPGPDFVQTGDRLRSVIVQLWEQALRIVIDTNILGTAREGIDFGEFDILWSNGVQKTVPDFRLVYSKEWSVNKLQGGIGMSLK